MSEEEEYHWVWRGGRPYLRKKPPMYDNPPPGTKRSQAAFARAAHSARDQTGLTEIVKDGQVKDIPPAAAAVREQVTGIKVAPPKPRPARAYKFMGLEREKLRALLEALVRARR